MKIKNTTNRNVNIIGGNTTVEDDKGAKGFAKGFQCTVPAQSTLEITDDEYRSIEKEVKELVDAKVMSVVASAESKLTKSEIIDKVLEEADVELSDKSNKAELQEKAEALGVSV